MINFEKSELTPTQDFEFIGMHFWAQDFTVATLPKMRTKVQAIPDHWRFATTVSAFDIHSMRPTIQRPAAFSAYPVVGMGPDRGLGPSQSHSGLGNPSAGRVGFPSSWPRFVTLGLRYWYNTVYRYFPVQKAHSICSHWSAAQQENNINILEMEAVIYAVRGFL